MTATAGTAATRWTAIDAARGVAMLFVCLAHFGSGYFSSIGEPQRQTLTYHINRFLTVGYPRWAMRRRAASPRSSTARAHPDTLPEASAAR